ncbi:MAG TPA: hypothetical protein DCQ29_14090 [Chitinophagaceae bacterium]|nr:hypothetical protein [Chitinophagaceae bacterium]
MLKSFISSLAILLCCYTSDAQTLAGNWIGQLDIGFEIAVMLQVTQQPDSTYTATFSIPDQRLKYMQCAKPQMRNDSILVNMPMLQGRFIGKLSKNTWNGFFIQREQIMPLVLQRSAQPLAFTKPQTPTPPYTYASDSIILENNVQNITLAGTLTHPTTQQRYPTVILITGSGPQDRDETIGNHKPFAVWADYLTKKGYQVLRIDDRGVGKSKGNFVKSTTLDFATDIHAAVDYVKTLNTTDTNNIILMGHSEGGLIAPMAAAERADIKGIILLAGTGVTGYEVLRSQIKALVMANRKASEKNATAYQQLWATGMQIALQQKDTATGMLAARNAVATWYQQHADSSLAQELGYTSLAVATTDMLNNMKSFYSPWMQTFLQLNPADYVSKLRCHVRALFAARDIQVIPNINEPAISKAVATSQAASYATKTLPQLNHLFQQCKQCNGNEYIALSETINPTALATVGLWLQEICTLR